MRTIGIDFGTCNIKAAEQKKNGIANLKLGMRYTDSKIPNVILYEYKDGEKKYRVGKIALEPSKKSSQEQDRIRYIKQHLQEREWVRELSTGQKLNAYDVTLDIMSYLYDGIHNTNKTEDISATITVPVNFSKRQQMIVKKAAQKAGFKVQHVITEPFASLVYLLQEHIEDIEDPHMVLVFDFGGGTLDLCLAEVKKKNKKTCIATQSTVGISYGGNHINEAMLEHIFKKRKPDEIHAALHEQENKLASAMNYYQIMDAIRDAKEELFEEEDVELVDFIGANLYDKSLLDLGELNAQDVYQMLDHIGMKKTIENLLNYLFENSEEAIVTDVTDVFLVGGTSAIPYFRTLIQEYFRKNKHDGLDSIFDWNDDMDRDERIYTSVAAGAALYDKLILNESIMIKDKIPFVVYADKGAKVSLLDSYKGYASPYQEITKEMRQSRKIGIYQTIWGEEDKEVFLDDISLTNEIVENSKLYRIFVDPEREITLEFAHRDKGTGELCIDGSSMLEIRI